MKRVALITGGTRGIGFGIATQLAREGFNIAVNGTRPEDAVQTAIDELKASGAAVIYCRGSIASATDRENMIRNTREHYGALHILVNNAGIAPRERKDILDATEESYDEVMSTNLKGCYFLTQKAANWMIEQKQQDKDFNGCIINVSSISATVASVNRGEYCLSKAGLSMATQLFAVRLGEYNIPVYEVRPGIIRTDMTAGVKEKYDKLISEGLCVQKRWGEPEDVARAVAALAKGSFLYSTGQVIMVDGGMTIPRL
ncbi:MAG: 3-ketoacyl-ACP reductase [Chitinophagaceae bacterium]|nr:3-ketoacyl-ACP reductase [Chitinophagaceae bacterium]